MHNLTAVASAVSELRPALCITVNNPLDPASAEIRQVVPGTLVRDLAPTGVFPAVCRLDGGWLLRAGWSHPLEPGQVVEFYTYPQGGGDNGGSDVTRAVLTIAAIYAAVQFGQWYGGQGLWGGAAVGQGIAMVALTAIINMLVPVNAGSRAGDSSQTATSYNAALSGNQARLEQPIPVLYGRNRTFPDFAGEPYVEYLNDDQYYYAVLCLGQGEYTIESISIDDTNINNFSDVKTEVLPPGSLPTIARASVVSAPEVTGQTLTAGRYAGPFIGCRARSYTDRIGIDITFSRGLCTYDSAGVPGNKTVGWKVEWRQVDDFGGALTPWAVLATESLTLAQTAPVRRSYYYSLSTPCRPQVRVVRTTPFDDNSRVANTAEWAGFRCYLARAVPEGFVGPVPTVAPLCPTATHLAVAMRASEQLSGLSQRKIAVVSRRKLRTWSPGGGWTAVTETRNFAWALADKWTNTVYGDGYADSRCDLNGLYERALVADSRQDRFDGVFDQTYDSFTADQMIAQSNRCAVFRRSGLMTLTRDELKVMPVTGYSSRNIKPGSLSVDYLFSNENTPDGIIVEYWHNRIWDWQEILCPLPGVSTPVRPQRMRLFGVTGPTHAEREGLYHAANALYRRKLPSFSTELEGMIPAFGSAVVFAPSLPGWGRGGDVVSYDKTTLTVTLTEPPAWTSAAVHYITFINRDGSLSSAIPVIPGSNQYQAILSTAPAEALSTDNPSEERTRYLFGAGSPFESIMRVLSIRSNGEDPGVRTYTISGVIEDDRVHAADNALLPVPGVEQDSVDPANPDDGSSSGDAYVPYLVPLTLDDLGSWITGASASIEFRDDSTTWVTYTGGTPVQVEPDTWLLGRVARSTAVTGLFEIRATLLTGPVLSSGTMNTWQALSTSRSWSQAAAGEGALVQSTVLFEIRDAGAPNLVQTSAVVTFTLQTTQQHGS